MAVWCLVVGDGLTGTIRDQETRAGFSSNRCCRRNYIGFFRSGFWLTNNNYDQSQLSFRLSFLMLLLKNVSARDRRIISPARWEIIILNTLSLEQDCGFDFQILTKIFPKFSNIERMPSQGIIMDLKLCVSLNLSRLLLVDQYIR